MSAPNQTPQPVAQLSFAGGMMSHLDPLRIPGDDSKSSSGAMRLGAAYRVGTNIINRGGFITTRPGNEWKVTFPQRPLDIDGNQVASSAQGAIHFKTLSGQDYLVCAVDGAIYYASYPFTEWHVLPIRLRADVSEIYFAVCEQALTKNNDGSVASIDPRRVLVIQDGTSRPLVWDGNACVASVAIPAGACMAWSGNRLWVADGPKLYASDIGDPTSFDETAYLGIGGSFLFPLRITAMSENTDGNLFVWTETSMHLVSSGVRDRSLWQSTTNFIQTVSNTVGCVSNRSVRQQYGMTWWMSRDGLANYNSAYNTKISSVFPVLDSEMAISKAGLHQDLTRCCLGTHGNFLLVSVPYGSTRNKHTWVMDAAPLASVTELNAPPVWSSIWTGFAPAAWISGFIASASRCYQLSHDEDGRVSLWEAFSTRTDDHGIPIRWSLETRGFGADGFTRIEVKRVDLRLANIRDTLDLAVFLSPSHYGAYRKILTHRAVADVSPLSTSGSITPYTEIPGIAAGQMRLLSSQTPTSTVNVPCDPQVPRGNALRAPAWSVLIAGVGHASLLGLRLTCVVDSESLTGTCADNTDGSAIRAIADGTAFTDAWTDIPYSVEMFRSSQTHAGFGQGSVSAEAASFVSQQAADRIALAIAESTAATTFLSTEGTGLYGPRVRVAEPPALPA